MEAELSLSSTCDFEFWLQQTPMLKGRATVLACQAEDELFRVLFAVSRPSQRLAQRASERLTPLVEPEVRETYLKEMGVKKAPEIDSLAPWIENSSRLHLLLETLADINSTMETNQLLSSIMLAAQKVVEAEASSLLLLDSETRELVVTIPTGPASIEILGSRIPLEKGIAGWVVRNKEAVIVEDVSRDDRFFGDLAPTEFKTRDLICVPMRSPRGEIIGVLEAVNRKGGTLFNKRDLPLLLALAEQAAIAIEKDRLVKESIRRQVLEHELFLASEIQKGFWPREVPELAGVELFGLSRPAAHVGGDYYDFIPIDGRQLGLVVADVSGKGVAAALLMSDLRASLRTQVENQHTPAETVALVNNRLVGDTPSERFVTLFLGVLSHDERQLTYVNAGHNPPLLLDPRSGKIERLDVGGPIIGFRSNLSYEAATLPLQPGYRLILFSDGITEAENADEEMFGEHRLLELVKRRGSLNAKRLAQEVLQEVSGFVGSHPQSDDMTLVIASFEF